jgi:hypothetical protein
MEVFSEIPKIKEMHVAEGLTVTLAKDDDLLSQLRSCIASLGLKNNDSISESLFDTINILNNLRISNPVDKLFLQFLSTVALHIHNYRHEVSPEADISPSVYFKQIGALKPCRC